MATYVGRRSYGLYLWHYVWLTWLAGMGLLGVPLALGASFAIAELSWRLVERARPGPQAPLHGDRTGPTEPGAAWSRRAGPVHRRGGLAIGAVKVPA